MILFREDRSFELASIRPNQDGVFFESMPATGFGLLNSAKIDFELVLRRPIETTRITGHMAGEKQVSGNPVNQAQTCDRRHRALSSALLASGGALVRSSYGGKHGSCREASKASKASCETGDAEGGASNPPDRTPSGTQDAPCWTESHSESATCGTPRGTWGKTHREESRPGKACRGTPCGRSAGNDRRGSHKLGSSRKQHTTSDIPQTNQEDGRVRATSYDEMDR